MIAESNLFVIPTDCEHEVWDALNRGLSRGSTMGSARHWLAQTRCGLAFHGGWRAQANALNITDLCMWSGLFPFVFSTLKKCTSRNLKCSYFPRFYIYMYIHIHIFIYIYLCICICISTSISNLMEDLRGETRRQENKCAKLEIMTSFLLADLFLSHCVITLVCSFCSHFF